MFDEFGSIISAYDPKNPWCDEEQLKFLKECIAEGPQGIKKWNQWRKDNENDLICLQHAILNEAYLKGAKLRWALLQGAKLGRAHLEGADLRGAKYDDSTIWPNGFTPPPGTVKVEGPLDD